MAGMSVPQSYFMSRRNKGNGGKGAIIDGGDSTEMYHLGAHRRMRPGFKGTKQLFLNCRLGRLV